MRGRLNKLQAVAVATALGGFFLYFGLEYRFGTPRMMGPGFLPVVLAVAMLGVAALILVTDAPPDDRDVEAPNLRSIFWIGAGILAFALVVGPFGLAPAFFACTLISALASPRFHPLHALAVAAAMALAGTLVFVNGIGLPIPAARWP